MTNIVTNCEERGREPIILQHIINYLVRWAQGCIIVLSLGSGVWSPLCSVMPVRMYCARRCIGCIVWSGVYVLNPSITHPYTHHVCAEKPHPPPLGDRDYCDRASYTHRAMSSLIPVLGCTCRLHGGRDTRGTLRGFRHRRQLSYIRAADDLLEVIHSL